MRQVLEQIYYREMFRPSLLGLLMNPFYIIRRGLHRGIASHASYLHGKLLDFGCGRKPYQKLFDVQEHVGLELEGAGPARPEVDVYYDGQTLPFEDHHFDSVFTSEVLDDLFNLDHMLGELRRVLKPGGHMLLTLAFAWDEHDIPYDVARYTSFGIEHFLKEAGFEVVAAEKTTHYVETVFQMWNAYVSQTVLPKNKFLNLLMTPLLIAPVTVAGLLLSKALPKNDQFYHNNVVVARKPATDRARD